MANQAVMIDLETLSTASNAAILTIGAVRFDPLAQDLSNAQELYIRVDLDSCEEYNLHIDDSTIQWWSTQSAEAQEEAFSSDDRVHIADAFKKLQKFCFGCTSVWSNGAGFDVVICENIFAKLKRSPPWKYWQVRDVRTLFDLGIDPKMPKVTAHNALEDAKAQAIGVQIVCNQLQQNGISVFAKERK